MPRWTAWPKFAEIENDENQMAKIKMAKMNMARMKMANWKQKPNGKREIGKNLW